MFQKYLCVEKRWMRRTSCQSWFHLFIWSSLFDISPFKIFIIKIFKIKNASVNSAWIMTFKLAESPMGSKDTVLGKFWICIPSEGPKLLFQYLLLTIIDSIYKTVAKILLLRKVSNLDFFGIVAGISYISSVLRESKKNKLGLPTSFYLPFWPTPPSPRTSMVSHISTLANFWRPHFPL